MLNFIFNWIFIGFFNLVKTIFSPIVMKTICVVILTSVIITFIIGIIVFGLGFLFSEFNNNNLKDCLIITLFLGILIGFTSGVLAGTEYYFKEDLQ